MTLGQTLDKRRQWFHRRTIRPVRKRMHSKKKNPDFQKKEKKSLMTDITHYTIYHKSKRRAGFIPPASCLLRITTLWSQTAIPPPPPPPLHTGLGARTKWTKTNTWKTNCTFFKCRRNKTGICKYYVCRLVWVTGRIFSLLTTGASFRWT